MIELYCFVDEFLKPPPALAPWRPSPHAQPQFSDAEGLTIALWQGGLEVASRKQTSRLVAQNWRSAFPRLPSYKQGRVHSLLPQVGRLLAPTGCHAAQATHLYLMDSKPLPLCLPLRHGRVRVLRDHGAYFGKTSKGWVFGVKLHLLRHLDGRLLNIILPPGNCDERLPALLLVQAVDGGAPWGTGAIAGASAQRTWLPRPTCGC